MTDGGPNLGSPNGARFWVHKAEELNEGLRRESHAAGVLAVGRVERCGAALHLASEEGEVHEVRGNEEERATGNLHLASRTRLSLLGCIKLLLGPVRSLLPTLAASANKLDLLASTTKEPSEPLTPMQLQCRQAQ